MKVSLAALFVLLPVLAWASPTTSRTPSPGERCLSAIQTAERQMHIPSQLLRSIALVESGRPDPVTGRMAPWPWTINVSGTGYFFASIEEAVAAVRNFQTRGIKSIDVGCAQVNLLHHPTAFNTLERAFDPEANANYAARFLKSLYGGTGNWPRTAAAYHSRLAERGNDYARKVLALWPLAERYGPLPASASPAINTGADYSMYLPEFAARLRRMDEDRAGYTGAGTLLESAWARRLPSSPQVAAGLATTPAGTRRNNSAPGSPPANREVR
ncbi:lytic transglycosylase domain-containing protein [Belnapia rosea]|uniref:Transglycosylase SLT domain-containing protein n=1 Tax=Belnapia rosea TaxID=938405 RepID=A0A1G7EIA1_9PROT|nr:lytic transglycosylase domain-containing protein [Belnapia rosea]SDE63384.1 Transglycosylase SLT domain-containing protein [Belnapia rosea]